MNSQQQETPSFALLQATTERLLRDYYQSSVLVEHAALLTKPERRNRLWRCHLHATDRNVPETLIVKQVNPESYSPSTPASWNTSRFFREWAGAQFLSMVVPEEGHGPAFYGGDVERGFILLEDLGEPVSLVEPLLKGEAASATQALCAFARRLGRMHASAFGKEEFYRDVQRRISPLWAEADVPLPENASEETAKQIAEFSASCLLLNVEAGARARQEHEEALLRLAEPGPFQTFLHGDPCPDNVFYHAPDLRLIDFEFSGFGHALRDGLYGRLPFPTCWCANTVPALVVQQMERLYRAELSAACPQALNEAYFEQEACVVAAASTLNSVRWDMEGALKQEEPWGIAGTRERILSRITMFLDTAQSARQMPASCELYAILLNQLHSVWPDATPLPVYPAFRAGAMEEPC